LNVSPSIARSRTQGAAAVAQTALYGYLRTQVGLLYPELLSNDAFMISVRNTKGPMWLPCLSDFSIFRWVDPAQNRL
jgi:hypothetical protein